jgi:uncharacterized membrane protein YccC
MMIFNFRPTGATMERVKQLTDLLALIQARCIQTERALADAQEDHEAMLKLERFINDMLERCKRNLNQMHDESGREEQQRLPQGERAHGTQS